MERLQQVAPWILVFLVGLGGGWGLSAAFEGDPPEPTPAPSPLLDPDDVVLYETASSIFPVEGAQFTEPFDDPDDPEAGCDKERLKASLNADSHRKEAWLELQGITEDEFDEFVDRLVSVVLTEPRPVTNHGCFPEGEGPCAFEVHSVLAAGTLVLADPETEQVVVRCRCGNPLKPPQCPPNCEGEPTPTPTVSPSPTPRQTDPPPRTATPRPTPTPTPAPTPTPTPCPEGTEFVDGQCVPTETPTPPPPTPTPTPIQ